MLSRYTRDEIIQQGLELADSPTISAHDMPNGVIDANAHSIKWLQNALDMFHKKYPFSTDIQSVGLTVAGSTDVMNSFAVVASQPSLYLPEDFMLDVRNGLIGTYSNSLYRLQRQSFQYFLNYQLSSQNRGNSPIARVYCIKNNRFYLSPSVATALSYTLYYYACPAKLTAVQKPEFPDEWTLVEFIRLKALEYTRSIDVGTAQMYMQKQLASFKASGLLNEPEYDDAMPIENNQVVLDSMIADRNSWMGLPVGQL